MHRRVPPMFISANKHSSNPGATFFSPNFTLMGFSKRENSLPSKPLSQAT